MNFEAMSPFEGVPYCTEETPSGAACLQRTDAGRGSVFFEDYQACAQSDILLPGFNLLPDWLLAITYGLALLWLFFGIAIISDTFMVAIEVITSKTRTISRRAADGRDLTFTVYTWNPTVANLTLMALGSSAPEIMLSIIETIVQLGKPPGELGASTIVGSAAFNLLIIPAVCIVALPPGETRRISQLGVFAWTAAVSLWAYIWLIIVYQLWTPDEITIEEAVLTLLYMPLLVGVAWRLDVIGNRGSNGAALETADRVGKGSAERKSQTVDPQSPDAGKAKADADRLWSNSGLTAHITGVGMHDADGHAFRLTPHQIAEFLREHHDLNDDEAAARLAHEAAVQQAAVTRASARSSMAHDEEPRSADVCVPESFGAEESGPSAAPVLSRHSSSDLHYKINARRMLAGRHHASSRSGSFTEPAHASVVSSSRTMDVPLEHEGQQVACRADVTFSATHYIVSESQQCARLCVKCNRREGFENGTVVRVAYQTRDGTAQSSGEVKDFAATRGTLVFAPAEDTKFIEVVVYEDEEVEEDECFYVELLDPGAPGTLNIVQKEATVVIMDSTEPGRFQFEASEHLVQNSESCVTLTVVRKLGAASAARVDYATAPGDALPGIDYEKTSGTLSFENGQKSAKITVRMLPTCTVGRKFAVVLSNAVTAELSRRHRTAEVQIVEDVKVSKIVALMSKITPANNYNFRTSSWVQQFAEAIVPGGTNDDDGDEVITAVDYLLHYISISWKVMFALTPPAEIGGGWPCFWVALCFIAGLTYIVAEMATLFGCACGLRDIITAITFVALGTSMPDTFASRQAAIEAPDADAAIGNVTGSNSVNVFLGLGLPWIIASVYYKVKDETFSQPSGDLAYSVAVYMPTAVIAIGLLLLKRRAGGELGGSGFMRNGIAAIFVLLWIAYLVLSSLRVYGHVPGF